MSKKSNSQSAEHSSTKPATKKNCVIELLRRKEGASLEEITLTTGWLPHTARAMLTGLRKQGFIIKRSTDGTSTRYTISSEPTT